MVWWFPSTGGARRGAFPLDPMEYVFSEGTGAPYDVMYDTVHAVPATPVSAAQSEIDNVTGYNHQRKLVRTSDGTLYVVYNKYIAGKWQVHVIKSVDNGATWIDDTHISIDGMAGNSQQYSCIAVDSQDNLHVVWYGLATGYTQSQIWYALYDGSWHTPIWISTAAGMATKLQSMPYIAVDSQDNLHVVWNGAALDFATYQIRYATAVPPYAAGDWVTPIRISDAANMATKSQNYPCIAVDGDDNLHVVWTGGANDFASTQTRYARAVPPYAAANWVTPIRISDAPNMGTNTQTRVCIAVDGDDNLHVVWYGVATGDVAWQIYYATAVPPHAAGNWVTPISISTAANMTTNSQYHPSIAVDSSDYIHVLWYGKATGYLAQDVVWLAVYVASWATPVCIQPTGRNKWPSLRWSRWPR